MTEGDFAAWSAQFRTAPTPIVPVPALDVAALRGCRIIIGLPGHGWRGDLRADHLVMQGAHSLVPVLVEAEWYRAEHDRVEVFASLVPAERVWVETVGGDIVNDPDHPLTTNELLVSLDTPPIRLPRPAKEATRIGGQRVVVIADGREERDLRAVTEPYETGGRVEVRVTREGDWYRWATTGKLPATRSVDIGAIWLE